MIEKDNSSGWGDFLLDVSDFSSEEEMFGKKNLSYSKNSDDTPKSILLVEDEEIVREMIRQILLSENYQVTTAENGKKALQICKSMDAKFDLMITDVSMPGMDGTELAEKVVKTEAAEKVLYISGYTDDKKILRDISNSKVYFLAKPFSPEVLSLKVREILDAA